MPVNYVNNLGQNTNNAFFYQQLKPNHNHQRVIFQTRKNEEYKGGNKMYIGNNINTNRYNQYRNYNDNLKVHRIPVQKGQQRNSNKGLYGDIKQMNSIVKNGKLVYNIDINNEAQGVNKEVSRNYINYINDKKYLYNNNYNTYNNKYNTYNNNKDNIYNNTNLKNNLNNYTNTNKNIYKPSNTSNNAIQAPRKQRQEIKLTNNNSFTNNNEIFQIGNTINQTQLIDNKPLNQIQNVNNNLEKKNNSQQKFISKNVKPINQSNKSKLLNSNDNNSKFDSKFINTNVIPNETLNTINPIKESDNIPYSKAIPQEIYNSIYPISKSKNNGLSKMIPQQTNTSVYQVDQSTDKDYLKISPEETIKSVYTNNIKESSNNKNNNTITIPQETLKSIYIIDSNNKNIINENSILAKIPVGETTTSVYKKNEEKSKIGDKENKNPISLIMPNETIVSVYKDPKNKLITSKNIYLNIAPDETVKSVYRCENSTNIVNNSRKK